MMQQPRQQQACQVDTELRHLPLRACLLLMVVQVHRDLIQMEGSMVRYSAALFHLTEKSSEVPSSSYVERKPDEAPESADGNI